MLVAQSHLALCDPLDCSHLAPLSLEFSRWEYWSGLPFLSPRDLPNPGIKHGSPTWQADSLPSEPPGKPQYRDFLSLFLASIFTLNSVISFLKPVRPGVSIWVLDIQHGPAWSLAQLQAGRMGTHGVLFLYYGEGNGTPLQSSCLENPMDGGAWWAAVPGVAKSWTRLNDFTFSFHFHALEKEMAAHSSVLAWRIPGTAEPGGLLFMGSHRVGHDWSDLAAAASLIGVSTKCPWVFWPFTSQLAKLKIEVTSFPVCQLSTRCLHFFNLNDFFFN